MKTIKPSFDKHICDCLNQKLLNNGSYCELCFGLITEDYNTELNQVANKPQNYDESYFEDLERFYDQYEYAA